MLESKTVQSSPSPGSQQGSLGLQGVSNPSWQWQALVVTTTCTTTWTNWVPALKGRDNPWLCRLVPTRPNCCVHLSHKPYHMQMSCEHPRKDQVNTAWAKNHSWKSALGAQQPEALMGKRGAIWVSCSRSSKSCAISPHNHQSLDARLS